MIIKMSWRNVWRNKIRSMVIMLSVSIGIIAGVFVLALYKGMMQSRVKKVIHQEIGHIQLHHPDFKKEQDPHFMIPQSTDVMNQLLSVKEIKSYVGRTITTGMLAAATGSIGVQIMGVQPFDENRVSGLKQKIITGDYFLPDKKNDIIIGKKAADKLKLTTGKKIVLTFTDTANDIVSSAFKIRGIFQSGNSQIDESNVYVTNSSLNQLLLTPGAVGEISVILDKDENLFPTEEKLKRMYPHLLVETWMDISPETDLMVKTVDDYSYIIIVIILIALSFGIINTMLMSVLERTKEIGVMMALGTSKIRILMLVILETVLLTITGIPVGFGVVYMLIGYFSKKGIDFSGTGKDMMASFGFDTVVYPSFPSEKISNIMLLVACITCISCLFPVIKALRLRPVSALQK